MSKEKLLFMQDLNLKMKKSFKKVLLIFDLDGTLYNSATSFLPALKRLFKEYGIEYNEEEAIKFIGEPDYKFWEYLKTKNFKDNIDKVLQKMDDYEYSEVEKSGKLYSEVREILQKFKKKGYTLSLCSNGIKEYIEKVLKKFDLLEIFSDIRYPLNKGETKDRMVGEILEKHKPEMAFMIGDRYHDMMAAFKNGIVFIGAMYGFGKREIEKADYKIEKFKELEELIERLVESK